VRIAVAGATGLVGARLCTLAREAGHEVVEIARAYGVDLCRPDGLDELLAGCSVVVDVTSSPTLEREGATLFFETVAHNLGRAATAAGVRRTVVLSIVGIDQGTDYGFYAARVAHERAFRASAPGVVVLRTTQFHEFAGQVLARSTKDGVARIMDVPSQPVDTAEVARLLLDLATGERRGDTDLAGPRQERLVDQVRRLVESTGADVRVEAGPAPASMAAGSMLPGPDALLRGTTWDEWLAQP
jgi:uncharacterized protein YbjT (DUF2867 family)